MFKALRIWFEGRLHAWRGHIPIYGRDWNYEDERKDKVIGYKAGYRTIITDRKTFREILP